VDLNTGSITDTFESFVWEPALVKINAITAATEATCMVLSVDETVRNPRSEDPSGMPAAKLGRIVNGRAK
jgi:T-complex protein 1 subunit eta